MKVSATTTDGTGGSAFGRMVVVVVDPEGLVVVVVVVTGSDNALFIAPSSPPQPGALTGTASSVNSGSTIDTVPVFVE